MQLVRRSAITSIRRFEAAAYPVLHPGKKKFQCPICNYRGPFKDNDGLAGLRKHSICPKCGSMERHRLQYCVLQIIQGENILSKMEALHFAPEGCFIPIFKRSFRKYVTADLSGRGVDQKADLRKLPFATGSFDFVWASHVLEHIKEDREALAEIRRVLRPGGLAILPVPIVCHSTVEYPEANPHETYHVRAPGVDYYDRYREWFKEVRLYSSGEFDPAFQLFLYEDRSGWPTPEMPLRTAMQGDIHPSVVPLCLV